MLDPVKPGSKRTDATDEHQIDDNDEMHTIMDEQQPEGDVDDADFSDSDDYSGCSPFRSGKSRSGNGSSLVTT